MPAPKKKPIRYYWTRTYVAWSTMKTRCYNRKRPEWPRYGGRGIGVCLKWKGSYHAFLADMGECPPGHTLDRKDNELGYYPGNCRWSDRATQARNRSTSKLTPELVLVIKARAKAGELFSSIAADLDVHRTTIGRVVSGLRWGASNAHV